MTDSINASLFQALVETTKALKDIINASNNGVPYSPEELESLFSDALNIGENAVFEASGQYTN